MVLLLQLVILADQSTEISFCQFHAVFLPPLLHSTFQTSKMFLSLLLSLLAFLQPCCVEANVKSIVVLSQINIEKPIFK